MIGMRVGARECLAQTRGLLSQWSQSSTTTTYARPLVRPSIALLRRSPHARQISSNVVVFAVVIVGGSDGRMINFRRLVDA